MLSNFERLSLTLNNTHVEDNLLATNPAFFAGTSKTNDQIMASNLMASQNYGEKFKDLENVLTDEKKTNEELKKIYKTLKSDYTKFVLVFLYLFSLLK